MSDYVRIPTTPEVWAVIHASHNGRIQVEELARLTALFGFDKEAQEAFDGARQGVFEWRATRKGDAA